jgi:hypothetical protein
MIGVVGQQLAWHMSGEAAGDGAGGRCDIRHRARRVDFRLDEVTRSASTLTRSVSTTHALSRHGTKLPIG